MGLQNVHFLGHLDQLGLGDEMRRADVFLFPSELEGHPQVLLQATACGLPCIAMDSYHPDSVVNGVSGFLVSGEAELAEKLDLLLNDAMLRESMAKAAVQHVARFDWDLVTADWARAFEAVLRKDL
jgi:glycosyltransferase involved in cell wall biosynthesis